MQEFGKYLKHIEFGKSEGEKEKLDQCIVMKLYALESKLYPEISSEEDLVAKLQNNPEETLAELNSMQKYLLHVFLKELKEVTNLKDHYFLGECNPEDLARARTLQEFFKGLLKNYESSDAEATYFMMSSKIMENSPVRDYDYRTLRFSFINPGIKEIPSILTMYWHAVMGTKEKEGYVPNEKEFGIKKYEKDFFSILKDINQDFIGLGQPICISALNFLKPFLYQLWNLRGERRVSAIGDMLNLRYPFGDVEEKKEWREFINIEYR